ncbi:MAG TPA: metal-sensitive transcriptional regulator [Acidimicrobiales bacterium]|nr:metal-sensitive transcriptional regulator [Acidimicrobiales bacterium]
MEKFDTSHVLQDKEQLSLITKRLKRANGQMTAVVRMLEEGRSCEDVITQMAAVNKAINTAAFMLISSSLKECIVDPTIDTESVTDKLQKLFLSLA